MNEPIKKIVKSYFNDDDGKLFEITDGQVEIFNSIFLREHRRVQVIAPTQFGKSTIVAMALILRSQVFGEKWAIVTGSQPKSDIIMEKVIQHVFDDPRLYTELDIDDSQLLDRLRRERSKKHLTWRCGGGIRTFTADARNRQRVKEALMGFGCIPKGFKIMTDIGEVEISELVKNKCTDKVLSYNHKEEKAEFKNILEYQKNDVAKRDLIELDLGDKKIRCTEDHPVWVIGEGYVRADKVLEGDKVCALA